MVCDACRAVECAVQREQENIELGPIDLFFSLHLPRLEEALSRDGVSIRVARPPESSTLFLEASRGGRGVTVPPHLREQMMTELVTPDCIFAAIDEILKLNEANPSEAYDSRIVVFGKCGSSRTRSERAAYATQQGRKPPGRVRTVDFEPLLHETWSRSTGPI